MKNKTRSIIASGLVGLAGLVETAAGQTSGGITYFASRESKSPAPNSYVELDHSTQVSDTARVSGFLDLYEKGGYFGKTSLDKTISKNSGLRAQAVHGNEYLSQVGVGVNYTLPTPENTFAVVRYIPAWFDRNGNHVNNKQIVGYFASANLPKDLNLWSFGELNIGKRKPLWAYGEAELSKKLTENTSIGINAQLNGKGGLTPEVVPRIAFRAKF